MLGLYGLGTNISWVGENRLTAVREQFRIDIRGHHNLGYSSEPSYYLSEGFIKRYKMKNIENTRRVLGSQLSRICPIEFADAPFIRGAWDITKTYMDSRKDNMDISKDRLLLLLEGIDYIEKNARQPWDLYSRAMVYKGT